MGSSWPSSRIRSVVGSCLYGPAEAVAVLRVAVGTVRQQMTVAVFLDAARTVVALAPVRSRRSAALVEACGHEDVDAVALVTFVAADERGRMPALAPDSWRRGRARLADAGLFLLDWPVISDGGWSSLGAGDSVVPG
jgi:hypothetical protein